MPTNFPTIGILQDASSFFKKEAKQWAFNGDKEIAKEYMSLATAIDNITTAKTSEEMEKAVEALTKEKNFQELMNTTNAEFKNGLDNMIKNPKGFFDKLNEINKKSDYNYKPKDLVTGKNITSTPLIEANTGFVYDKEYLAEIKLDAPLVDTSPFIDVTRFKAGNYALPDELRQGALNFADEIIQKATKENIDLKKTEFGKAAGLDGNKNNLTREEVASYLMATSLANNTSIDKDGSVVSKFDGIIEDVEAKSARGENSGISHDVILEIGKQIFGDTFDKSMKTDTQESDKNFTSQISKKIPTR